MAFIEIILVTLNQSIGELKLGAIDMGGSMYIHAFGGFFGLAVVLAYKFKKATDNVRNGISYNSVTFAFIGTLFLWAYWPSFNSALASGNGRQRIIVNTFFSIASSALSTFLITPFWNNGKFTAENILNSTIAGGVVVGACADLI